MCLYYIFMPFSFILFRGEQLLEPEACEEPLALSRLVPIKDRIYNEHLRKTIEFRFL